MITFVPPYYLKNKDWYYYDPRYNRHRLTDKATKKAVESYICQLPYAEWIEDRLVICHQSTEKFSREVKEDVRDFKANKQRYTFKFDEKRNCNVLVAVDGVKIKGKL